MCRRCDIGDLPLPTLRRVRHLLADVNGDKVMKVCHEAVVIYLWVSKGRGQGRQGLERVETRVRAETQELPCQIWCYWHCQASWQHLVHPVTTKLAPWRAVIYSANFIVTGGIPRYPQWRQSWHHDNSPVLKLVLARSFLGTCAGRKLWRPHKCADTLNI